MSSWLPQWLRHALIVGAVLLFCALGAYELYGVYSSKPKIDQDGRLETPVNRASSGNEITLKSTTQNSVATDKLSAKPKQSISAIAPILVENSANAELAICGLSQSEAAQIRAAPNAISMVTASAALAQPVAQLIQNTTPAERALGLYLQVLRANWQELDAAARARQNNSCQNDATCASNAALALQKSLLQATQNAVAPLVKLALTKSDPSTYAAAVYACNIDGARDVIEDEKGVSSQPTCGAINVAQWAAIDGDNAVPWLMLAAQPLAASSTNAGTETREQQSHREYAVVEMAINRALAARHYTSRFPSVSSVFDDGSVKGMPPFVQATLANEFLGLQHAQTAPQGLSSYCAAPYFGTEKRRLNCNAIANKMLQGDQSLLALLAAADVGRALKWDSARLSAMRDERVAITQLLNEKVDSRIKLNCENVETLSTHLQKVLRQGERAVGRELIIATGKTASQLVAEDAHK